MRKRIFLRKQYILFLSALLFLGFNNTGLGQTVTTDKLDYAPGETVMITGTGFLSNETIVLEIEHIEPNMPVPFHTHTPWETIADSEGNFTSTWYVDTPELNTTLLLTATGQTSGLQAETIFTDGSHTGFTSAVLSGAPMTICSGASVFFISYCYYLFYNCWRRDNRLYCYLSMATIF